VVVSSAATPTLAPLRPRQNLRVNEIYSSVLFRHLALVAAAAAAAAAAVCQQQAPNRSKIADRSKRFTR
jgi:hypothetical protein